MSRPRPGWLVWHGERVSLFEGFRQWDAVHRAYFDEVGVGPGKFLFLAGLRTSAGTAAGDPGAPTADRFRESLRIVADAGYGSASCIDVREEASRAVVVVDDSMEAWSIRRRHGSVRRPVCDYLRGVVAGLWYFLLSVKDLPDDLVCWEVECAAMGAPRCRFELGSAAALTAEGFVDLGETGTVRWELLELNRRLTSSSERLHALESALAERERAYQSLVDNMNDALLVLDQERRVVYCNRRFLEHTGLTWEEAAGSTPMDRILPEDRKRVDEIYEELLQGLRSEATYRFRVQRPHGSVVIESSAKTIAGPNGEILIETLGRDVTEREATRQELERTHASLVHKQQLADIDLRVAKRVHESLLPKPVRDPRVWIDVKYVPVERVGGDYAQIHIVDDKCLVTVCDVSGHGTASALLASRVSSQVLSISSQTTDPLTITKELNQFLDAYFSDTGLFVTFFAMSIDLRTLDVEYCGAGHPGPMHWRRADGVVDTLPSHNLPVGICADFLREPASGRTRISPGDRILLYTDGVTETTGPDDAPLRASGLEKLFVSGADVALFDLGKFLLDRLKAFRATKPHDDMTLLMVEIPATR